MSAEQLSLLDTAGYKVRDWYVVYFNREPYRRIFRWLKPGFRHVELARPIYYGPGLHDVAWLHLLPMFEMLDMELAPDSRAPWERCPEATVQKVTAMRPLGQVRSWWDMGPSTCVETAKMALGIRSFWVRTPYQLFKYIQKRNGVLINGRRWRWWRELVGSAARTADPAGRDEREPQS